MIRRAADSLRSRAHMYTNRANTKGIESKNRTARITSRNFGACCRAEKISRQCILFAFARTPAVHSASRSALRILTMANQSKPSVKTTLTETPTTPFTRTDFFSLVAKASKTPVQKPAPKSRGKSDSRNRGGCTGTNTRPDTTANISR